MILGITGGLATGKSSAASFLADTGVRIVDADVVAHYLTSYDPGVLLAISTAFGPACFKSGGALDRVRLAEIVFADPKSRLRLEEILHPPISAVLMSNIRWARLAGRHLITVIPLLFENGWENLLDTTLVISCSAQNQHARASERGMGEEQISQRIAAQMPLSVKESRAGAVIRNNGTLDELREAVLSHWEGCIAVQGDN